MRLPLCFFTILAMSVASSQAQETKPANVVEKLLAERWVDWQSAAEWTHRTAATEPGDKASDQDVLRYWDTQLPQQGIVSANLPTKTRQRLLKVGLSHPESLNWIINFVPDDASSSAAIKQILDHPPTGFHPDDDWKKTLHDWLMLHSDNFRADLIAAAGDLKFTQNGTLENEEARTALAKMDWPKAEPILTEDAQNGPYFAVGAVSLLYEHALAKHDEKSVAALRERLLKWAADVNAPAYVRSNAFAPLVAHDWPGRTASFGKLLADRSLDQLSEGLYHFSNPLENWAEVAGKDAVAVGVPALADPALRNAAANVLLAAESAESLRPLLGCLTEPEKWPEHVPRDLIFSLQRIELPESVPPLEMWLKVAPDDQKPYAALAIAHQDAKAAPAALKAALAGATRYQTRILVGSLFACDGISTGEIVAAMEAAATGNAAHPGTTSGTQAELLADVLLETVGDRAGVAEAMLKRIGELPAKNSDVARGMWKDLQAFTSPVVDHELLRRLQTQPVDFELVTFAIHRAARIRAAVPKGLQDLARGTGERAGLAAALLGDPAICTAILTSNDAAAQRMLLAAARLAGTNLPLAPLGTILHGKDAALTNITERYLLANDSAEARKLVRADHPTEYLILGQDEELHEAPPAKDSQYMTLANKEIPKLIQEMRGKNPPDEIFALYSGGGFGTDGQRVLRLHDQNATLDFIDDDGKPHQRPLTPAERQTFLNFIHTQHIDDLHPLLNTVFDGVWYDYFHLTKDGGVHIFMDNPGTGAGAEMPHIHVVDQFHKLTQAMVPPPDPSPFQ